MYYISILLAASAGVLYHVSQKSIPDNATPAVSMMITFATALIGTIIWFQFDTSDKAWLDQVKDTNWASISLGTSLIGLELGILMAYRAGWKVSNFSVANMTLLALFLLPVGVVLFKETVSVKTVVGLVVALTGIAIMKL
jgi:drug/metabolite transporter (DMT)-like permease